MRKQTASVLLIGLSVLAASACSSSSGDGGGASGTGGGGSNCDAKELTCGQCITTDQLATILGESPETYDESGHPHCSIQLVGPGGGGVQVFCGNSYDSMLGGAHTAYPDTTEPNTIGQKSFEVDIAGLSEVGFLTTDGKYAVLVDLITDAADIAHTRSMAQQIDQNL